jgi:hypothetical protein
MTDRRFRLALLTIAAVAALVVFTIAATVFPHHSSNHDEGVYLQQADLLLDGQFSFTSQTPEAVQPWFFVRDGQRLYPKYTPVPASIFALGVAVGSPRLALALVAALSVGLAGLVTREAFEDRTGILAAVLVLGSPLFLIDASVFLPYAPTAMLNLTFALGYLRTWGATAAGPRRRYASLAGVAVGLAFFARPLTAILFAAPFVCHSVLALATSLRQAEGDAFLGVHRSVLERTGIVATLGLAGVLVTLGYNQLMTGDPLVFPYQVFAPLDGPGFGYRRILGYDRLYTPALALEANAIVLWRLFTRWTVAAPLGTVVAAIGIFGFLARARKATLNMGLESIGDTGRRALLAGLLVTIPAGNVFFWGNLNILAALDDPTDGLISQFGPFYHFDLLLPLAAFGAVGSLMVFDRARNALSARLDARQTRAALLVGALAVLAVAGVAQASALGAPIDRTEPYTERYDRAYEPFEDREFENALIFLPTPYGDWLNHPFQSLRNGPDLGGDRVYALDRNASSDFGVIAAHPDRTPYRYDFRGEWIPNVDAETEPIVPTVERLRVRTGDRHRLVTTVGRVEGAESVSIRLATDSESALYGVDSLPPERLTVEWVLTPGRAELAGSNLRRYSDIGNITFEGTDELVLTVTFTQPGGSTVTYRQAVSVSERNGAVRVIWPPQTQVCRLVTDCGTEGTYVSGTDDYVPGVSITDSIKTFGRSNRTGQDSP